MAPLVRRERLLAALQWTKEYYGNRVSFSTLESGELDTLEKVDKLIEILQQKTADLAQALQKL